MTETIAALLGATIGALAGIAGSGVAALASLRSSQLAARVPLAQKIHELSTKVVQLNAAVGTQEYGDRLKDFLVVWNDLIIHQKILVPSKRLHLLHEIVRDAAVDPTLGQHGFPSLAGEALNASTDIIAAYSEHMLRWRARSAERSIAKRFQRLVTPRLTSPRLLSLCSHL